MYAARDLGEERTVSEGEQVVGAVLGIDPGTRKMGWAVLLPGPRGGFQVLASGTLKPPTAYGLNERLGALLGKLQTLLDGHPIAALAIESAFVHKNPHTALALGQARGLPIALAAARSIPVFEYAPATVKKHLTGSGRATKEQVRQMIRILLALEHLPPEDEADAIAVGLAHVREQVTAVGHHVQARPELDSASVTPARSRYAALVEAAGGASRSRGRRGKR